MAGPVNVPLFAAGAGDSAVAAAVGVALAVALAVAFAVGVAFLVATGFDVFVALAVATGFAAVEGDDEAAAVVVPVEPIAAPPAILIESLEVS